MVVALTSCKENNWLDWKTQNEIWLQENAKKEGVITTPSGLQYKCIVPGISHSSGHVDDAKIVTINYTGKLINGKVFHQTQKGRPATFRLNELITGWITAMREMPVGSRWEVVIPYNLGYGSRPAGAIKAFSTLIFDITLLDVR